MSKVFSMNDVQQHKTKDDLFVVVDEDVTTSPSSKMSILVCFSRSTSHFFFINAGCRQLIARAKTGATRANVIMA